MPHVTCLKKYNKCQTHESKAQHQRRNETSRREAAYLCGVRNLPRNFDSRTLVHTVGGRVSNPWGPTRDVAAPTCQCTAQSERERSERPSGRVHERAHIGRRVCDRCMLGSRVECRATCAHILSTCRDARLRAAFRPVFGFGNPGLGREGFSRWAAWETPRA